MSSTVTKELLSQIYFNAPILTVLLKKIIFTSFLLSMDLYLIKYISTVCVNNKQYTS
jgi:hypothetical protein